MRKIVMMSALALAVAGCANQQGGGPLVRDLSDASNAVERSPEYQVKEGDTLYGIAWQHNLDYRDLAAINDIDPPYRIYPGQTIALREGAEMSSASASAASGSSGAVARGLAPDASASSDGQQMDWLLPDESAIERNQRLSAEREAVDAADDAATEAPREDVVAAENAPESEPEPESEPRQTEQVQADTESAPESAEQTAAASEDSSSEREERTYTPAETIDWQWPSDGDVVGEFGQGDSITAGIDIAGEKGQPVRAAGPGIVVYAGSGVRGYGNLILLKHNDQFLSAYAHNDSLNVSENDVVEAGEVIAAMGDSDAEDVRLHFEVRREGQPQDPLEFLPSR
ncbi:peptidoglycan DD-metalloendopeptidase family protein [Halomonas sp. CUBES01]|uniref:Peptidoglycan DD-metalloendopeptidase family protein n=1 Tax=Vreelandella gomseomensis TaxID=370766 RepID=A0ABU1G7N3_9GAMM|nr:MULTISPECIES: peptidoglycan DD-metalloendopeptidase family protein [Halomonas]MDR5873498.1 peptidoglycan DD-metalloendopeptidase family protein [Halomonas gomseomensis]MEC4768255.1 peptidoglycan DD-metalloendopeptidase family protein [Halomonas sp. CUBES01]